MKKTKVIKVCPYCQDTMGQVFNGHNRSGTQRVMCLNCKKTYTIEPKKHAHEESKRAQAIEMHNNGISGREIGRILNMDKGNIYNWTKNKK